MAEAENPRAVPGGNNPPEPVKDPLTIEAEERIATGNRYLTERADVTQWDDDMVQKVNAFISQTTATWNAIDSKRKKEKTAAIEAVERLYRDDLDMMLSLKNQLVAKRSTYLLAKEAQLKKEQAAREAEAREKQRLADEAQRKIEEEAAKVGGKPLEAERAALTAQVAADDAAAEAEKTPARATTGSGYGARSTGLRDYWSATIDDASLAFKHYNKKGNPFKAQLAKAVLAAIEDIANKDANVQKVEGGDVPGITFKKDRR